MDARETAQEIEEAAVRWVWRLDREASTPELEAELEAWLAGDTRRRGALLQAEAAWAMLDRGSQLAGVVPAERLRRNRLSRRALIVTGGGGAIAASVAGAAMFLGSRERYDTAVGEIRRVPLKDGSTAAINTRSLVQVELTPRTRRVKLTRGEAWFQVAKIPHRPFLVEAGRVRVQAVGTAFSVRLGDDGARVLVSEGVVETWVEGAEEDRVRIAAGQSAFVAQNASIAERMTGPSDVDRQLAWRSGMIDLAGETLAEAATEFNRYNERKLVIVDRALARERLHGVFRTDDPQGFAMAVQQTLGARIAMSDPKQIVIGAPGA